MTIEMVQEVAGRLRTEIAKAIVGQTRAVDLLLVATFSGGHLLLEGPPGSAKTLLAQSFARSLDLSFGRIQFTPDLMPGDVLGTNLFNFETNSFRLTKGPIFTDILLADEINRTPPKTQVALLEAMQERQATIDGTSYPLGDRFMVVATQNPLEQQGTYPLPEAQLDRFLFKHVLDHPDRDSELAIVERFGSLTGKKGAVDMGVRPCVGPDELSRAVDTVRMVTLDRAVAAYIVDIVRATRDEPLVEMGASPRAAAALASAARSHAALDGRNYVLPDDVKALVLPALRHRILLSPAADMEQLTSSDVVDQILQRLPAPR